MSLNPTCLTSAFWLKRHKNKPKKTDSSSVLLLFMFYLKNLPECHLQLHISKTNRKTSSFFDRGETFGTSQLRSTVTRQKCIEFQCAFSSTQPGCVNKAQGGSTMERTRSHKGHFIFKKAMNAKPTFPPLYWWDMTYHLWCYHSFISNETFVLTYCNSHLGAASMKIIFKVGVCSGVEFHSHYFWQFAHLIHWESGWPKFSSNARQRPKMTACTVEPLVIYQ